MAEAVVSEVLLTPELLQLIFIHTLDLHVLHLAAHVSSEWRRLATSMRGWRVLSYAGYIRRCTGHGFKFKLRRHMFLLPEDTALPAGQRSPPGGVLGFLSVPSFQGNQVWRLQLNLVTPNPELGDRGAQAGTVQLQLNAPIEPIRGIMAAVYDSFSQKLFVSCCEHASAQGCLMRICLDEGRETARIKNEYKSARDVEAVLAASGTGLIFSSMPSGAIDVVASSTGIFTALFRIQLYDVIGSDLMGPAAMAAEGRLLYLVNREENGVHVLNVDVAKRSANEMSRFGAGPDENVKVWPGAGDYDYVPYSPFNNDAGVFVEPWSIALTEEHIILMDQPELGDRANVLSRHDGRPVQRLRLAPTISDSTDTDGYGANIVVVGTRVVIGDRATGGLHVLELPFSGGTERRATADAVVLGRCTPRCLLRGHGSFFLAHMEEILSEASRLPEDELQEAWEALVELLQLAPYLTTTLSIPPHIAAPIDPPFTIPVRFVPAVSSRLLGAPAATYSPPCPRDRLLRPGAFG